MKVQTTKMTSGNFFANPSHDLAESLYVLRQAVVDEHFQNRKPSCPQGKDEITRDNILRHIETVGQSVTEDIAANVAPSLEYASTSSWRDIRFEQNSGLEICDRQHVTTVRFESLNSVKKFGLMMKVLSIMYRLVKTDQYCTKRDIYYQDPSFFGHQHNLDTIVDNLSCMLQIPRWHLHVLATSKGCIAGDLVFLDADNNRVDCRNTNMGVLVPTHVTGMHSIETSAMCVLVVEKDATFQKLLQDRLCEKLHPCILVTGKGFPDLNTRMLLRKLWDTFHIPTLALVDADPHGIEIMAVYKFGSKALSFETGHLAVPSIKWLGLLPSDIHRLGVPESALIPLIRADEDKGRELLSRPYMQYYPQWRQEVETILTSRSKAELQSLDAISPSFLSDVYLPSKIRCAGWL